eukprot:3217577-Rhodomonas_salina.1
MSRTDMHLRWRVLRDVQHWHRACEAVCSTEMAYAGGELDARRENIDMAIADVKYGPMRCLGQV